MAEDERSADDDRTVFLPGGGTASPSAAPPPTSAPPDATVFAPAPPPARREGAGIQVGDVLNHIVEVRRFSAGGGMGEVVEGVNVNS